MQQEQEHDRTEPASPFKLSEARKQGQVSKSLDVNSFLAVCALLAAMTLWGAAAWRQLGDEFITSFQATAGAASGSALVYEPLRSVAVSYFTIVLPFAAVGVVFAVFANLAQTGPIFSMVPLKPKFERINPVAGFKRVFNRRVLFEAVKSVIKLGFFGTVTYLTITSFWPDVPALYSAGQHTQALWLVDHGSTMLFRLALALAVVALLDLAWVRLQFARQMRMSRREIREEVKRREGDPLIRAKIRQLQRENLNQSSSLGRVGDADVLITNPDHFAVALSYQRGRMDAPQVVAKGRDLWAAEMKAIARRAGVPIHEQPALARQLFRHGQLDRPIPLETYVDVARIYGTVVRDRQRASRYEVRP